MFFPQIQTRILRDHLERLVRTGCQDEEGGISF